MKRWLVVAILACVLPVRALAQNGPGDAGISSMRLPNGLQVVVVEDHAAPVVQVATWYRFGSLYETPGKTGLAHALEHMMFRGTSHVSASGLDDVTARLGAEMNGNTDYDYTQFYFTMPSDKLDVALYLEADRMANATLRQEDWNVERGAVLSELDGDASSPFFSLLSRVRAAAYPNDAHGRTPIGNRDDVAHATAADIAAYYHRWYAPNNATLVISGDVNASTAFAHARRFFEKIPSRSLPTRPNQSPVAARGGTVESEFAYPFEVLDLAFAVAGDREPGEPAISTLATLISNERSPFYRALVQTNVALSIEADSDTQLQGGLLNVFIVLNPGHHGDEAQSIFQSTMNNVLKTGIDPELANAAKALTIADRINNADSVTGFGDLAGYTYGIVGEKVADEDSRLGALTPDDLTKSAARYLSQPTVVGHLRPTDRPAGSRSEKSDARASDDFSNRVPSGRIVEPAFIRTALEKPTTARSALNPVSFVLHNGIRVIVQRKADRATFTLRGLIRTAPDSEPTGREGVAQLTSEVANYGSATYAFEARRKISDAMGASLQTGATFKGYGRAADFDRIVSILADGEMHPTFPQQWFDLERAQLADSLQSQSRISGVIVEREYAHLLLPPDDPSQRYPTQNSVDSIRREALVDYAAHNWRPDRTTIVVVGNLTPDAVRNSLESAFGTWAVGGSTPSLALPPLPPAQGGHDYVGTEANQVYVRLGQPAIARTNPDYDAFTLLNEILGASGAFESRLWQELRQKRGLVYGVSSELNADADRGDFRIELNASPANVQHAIDVTRQQLRDLQNTPVSMLDLREARTRLVSGALLAESSADGQTGQLMSIAGNDLPLDYYQTLQDRYSRVSAADIQRVAKKYLRPNAMIQIFAGPGGPWTERAL